MAKPARSTFSVFSESVAAHEYQSDEFEPIMEVVGAFSAILTIATEFHRIYRRLRRCIKTLKYARDDIRTMCNEVATFKSLLCYFHRTVTEAHLADKGLSRKIKASNVAQLIVRSGETALDKLEDILDEVEQLRPLKAYSKFSEWVARLKWSTRKEAWTSIQLSLNSVKASANMLMTMIIVQNLVQKLNSLQAAEGRIPNEKLQELSLLISQAKTEMAQCKSIAKESKHVRQQHAEMLQISREVAAMASHLARSHIASHPELKEVLNHRGVQSFAAGSLATSTNTASSESPRMRPTGAKSPRAPPLRSSYFPDFDSLNSIHTTPGASPVAELRRPEEPATVSRLSSEPSTSPGPESGESETPPRGSDPVSNGWIPTALFGRPEPGIRPKKPRQSDTDLAEGPVIVDDDRGLREEFRRPRKSVHRATSGESL